MVIKKNNFILNIIVKTEQKKSMSTTDTHVLPGVLWVLIGNGLCMIIFDVIVNRQKDRQKDWSQSSYR